MGTDPIDADPPPSGDIGVDIFDPNVEQYLATLSAEGLCAAEPQNGTARAFVNPDSGNVGIALALPGNPTVTEVQLRNAGQEITTLEEGTGNIRLYEFNLSDPGIEEAISANQLEVLVSTEECPLGALLGTLEIISGGSACSGTATRPPGNTGTGMFTSGGSLYDPNGNLFVPRGVNASHIWFDRDIDDSNPGELFRSIDNIAALGANATRIQWQMEFYHHSRINRLELFGLNLIQQFEVTGPEHLTDWGNQLFLESDNSISKTAQPATIFD